MIRCFTLLLAVLVLFTSSCASIVSKSRYPVMITSSPDRADIVITDKRGRAVYQGTTPATVDLKSGSGYFGKAAYLVSFRKEGYDVRTVPINFKLDGWYIGNLLFGGLIGLLIIDPATGAMYKLDTNFVAETLSQSMSQAQTEPTKSLEVHTIASIPNDWLEHLVLLEE